MAGQRAFSILIDYFSGMNSCFAAEIHVFAAFDDKEKLKPFRCIKKTSCIECQFIS
jgi:hypothetical protein